MLMSKEYYIEQESNTCYIYGKNEDMDDEGDDINQYTISVQNYTFVDNELPNIISNYFITRNNPCKVHYFCSVIWNDIEFTDDNYDIYDYDPDPKCIVYVDDLSSNDIEQYLTIIDALGDLYNPSSEYKHFNIALNKIPLSEFAKEDKNKNIVEQINSLKKQFNKQ